MSKGLSKAVHLLWIVLVSYVCCAVESVPYSLVVTCWEKADLLAVVFCYFPKYFLVHIRIKGQVGALEMV